MDDLKPCPFCGGLAELFQSNGQVIGHNEYADDVGVKCTGCGVNIALNNYQGYRVSEREDEAIRLWNRRA